MSPRTGTSSPPCPTSSTLQRGQACITCRRKKMRCDGARPFCGQCTMTRRPEHCEYTDRQGRTYTEVLEERLRQLKERIQELESPPSESAPVLLHYPYASMDPASASSGPAHLSRTASPFTLSTSPPAWHLGQAAAQGLGRSLAGMTPALQQTASPFMNAPRAMESALASASASAPAVPIPGALPLSPTRGSGTAQRSPTPSPGDEDQPFLSAEVFPTLLEIFLPHAARLGFALHVPRFISRLGSTPTLTTAHCASRAPHTGLLTSIALWALRLSRNAWADDGEAELEQVALAHALHCVPTALSKASDGVELVQAEVLLALYFFCEGRLLEGRYHASAAVSAALSCRLHEIGAVAGSGGGALRTAGHSRQGSGSGLSSLASALPSAAEMEPPRDALELGERINVFWAAFILDRCWSVALGSRPVMLGDSSGVARITTPLPLEIEDYERETIASITNFASRRTLVIFTSDQADYGLLTGSSLLASRVIAASLFERATGLVGRHVEGRQPDPAFLQRVSSLERTISSFTSALARIATELASSLERVRSQLNSATAEFELLAKRRDLAVTRSIAHVAMIQLHGVFAAGRTGLPTPAPSSPALSAVSMQSSVGPGESSAAGTSSRLSMRDSGARRSVEQCLYSARAVADIVGDITMEDVDQMDVVVGVAWLTAARVILRERRRTPSAAESAAQKGKGRERQSLTGSGVRLREGTSSSQSQSPSLEAQLERLLGVMNRLAGSCPFMESQLSPLREHLAPATHA